jgi:hypothetical protein
MRNAVWALMAFGAACAIDTAPAAAKEFPYCIRGCDYGSSLGDCSFASYQQCQASASGRLAYCATNPYFSQSADLQTNRSSRRRY